MYHAFHVPSWQTRSGCSAQEHINAQNLAGLSQRGERRFPCGAALSQILHTRFPSPRFETVEGLSVLKDGLVDNQRFCIFSDYLGFYIREKKPTEASQLAVRG
jgi:hypothetical protein